MGYFEHKTIVVTGEGLHFKKAKELFKIDDKGKEVNMVSNIVGTGMNQYYSFFISPSGSKVGWEMDEYFNKKIDEMINYLNSSDCKFSDGSSFNSWFLAEYGETGRRIKKSNCKNMF
ncbi:hypothetical protein [uncultured Clostridium sp.]|uniref:hypothetical protein n=1 Tax=uncultured Clostridium sp. TaxID=59620 RepID=UPI002603E0FD|nr:hypothetical protein [uncultured Clostridium sp.]